MKTIRTANVAKLSLRLVEKDSAFIGLIFDADGVRKAQIEGADADDVWRRLHDEAGKANPKYFGFDGARARFLRFFPNGFYSANYAERERGYKGDAKTKLDATVPLEKAIEGSGSGEAVLSVFRATNLLSSFEMIRIQDVLRGPTADMFIRAAAKFTTGEMKPALAAAARQREVDGCDLLAVSLATGGADVPETRGHKGFCRPDRPPLPLGLRAEARCHRL